MSVLHCAFGTTLPLVFGLSFKAARWSTHSWSRAFFFTSPSLGLSKFWGGEQLLFRVHPEAHQNPRASPSPHSRF